jgi:uncharacterized protein (DUF1684 family)
MRTQTSPLIDLLDWRRTISELYSRVRASADAESAWRDWRATRDRLFAGHPQSPIPEPERSSFGGLRYADYDPDYRVLADIEPAPAERLEIGTSTGGVTAFTRFAVARFELGGSQHTLQLYWLEAYGGGLFLSYRDATSGRTSYGAGRYLFDSVKGADLGTTADRIVLDFNFSYNPSCAYDPRWACPLAPPDNSLKVEVRAGELAPHG